MTKDLSHWKGKKPKGAQFSLTEYHQRWREHNVDQYLVSVARQRAKKKNIVFNISRNDVTIPKYCPILGIKLETNRVGIGGGLDNSFSLDRLNPNDGYIPGNVQVISRLANNMKSTATPEQLLKFADWIYKTYDDSSSPA